MLQAEFMNSARRADGLDGLRGLAAAAVVLLHVWMFSGAQQPWQPDRLDDIVGTFGLALMMFFVLSGLLITTPWIRAGLAPGARPPRLGPYAARRLARILPAYWLCLGGSFLVMQAIDHPLGITAGELPIFAAFGQNQLTETAGKLNPPLWSLSIEITFYAIVPVIGLALIATIRRFGRTGALGVAAALTATGLLWTALVHEAGDDTTLVTSLPTFLPIFACGIAVAALIAGRTVSRPTRTALLLGGAGLVVADAWWHVDSTGWVGQVVRDLPAGVGFGMVAAAVATGPARILGSAPMRRLGDYSYGIYLWHMPVLYVLRDTGRWPDSPWLAYASVLGIATVLGAASWHLVERRIIAWAARRLKARDAETTRTAPAQGHGEEDRTGQARHGRQGRPGSALPERATG